jgi:hypothetical protein
MGGWVVKTSARTLQPGKSEKVAFLHFPEFFEGVGEKFSPQNLALHLYLDEIYRMSYCSKFLIQAPRRYTLPSQRGLAPKPAGLAPKRAVWL